MERGQRVIRTLQRALFRTAVTVLPGPPSRLWVPITRTSASAAAASSSLDAAWPSRRTPEIDSSGARFRASSRVWSSSSWPCSGQCRPCPSRAPAAGLVDVDNLQGGAPSIPASRAAPASAAELRDVPSMPTTTGPAAWPGLRRRRMTIKGQGEDPARSRQTDPATCPSTPPRPRLLTTRRRASRAASRSTGSREPCFHDTFDVGTGFGAAGAAGRRGGRWRGRRCGAAARAVRASSTPSARIASAECRSPLPSTPLTGPSFLVNTGQTQAWTTLSLYFPAAAYSAAHRTASCAASDPS